MAKGYIIGLIKFIDREQFLLRIFNMVCFQNIRGGVPLLRLIPMRLIDVKYEKKELFLKVVLLSFLKF